MLCDSQSGVCHNFKVYMGKTLDGSSGPHGLGYKVVKELTTDLKGKNHHLFFDSYFTSIPLLLSLHDDGFYCCGTVQSNKKGFPREFRQLPKMKQGVHHAAQAGQLTAYVWQDKRPVTLLSTSADPTQDAPALRRRPDGSRVQVSRPAAIAAYQANYRGVDKCDQLRAAYSVGRASRKWWRYRLARRRSTCKLCARMGSRKETVFGCIACNKHFCTLAHHTAYHIGNSEQ